VGLGGTSRNEPAIASIVSIETHRAGGRLRDLAQAESQVSSRTAPVRQYAAESSGRMGTQQPMIVDEVPYAP
jgi:hypothetical protein